jgi:hypothetical protein
LRRSGKRADRGDGCPRLRSVHPPRLRSVHSPRLRSVHPRKSTSCRPSSCGFKRSTTVVTNVRRRGITHRTQPSVNVPHRGTCPQPLKCGPNMS